MKTGTKSLLFGYHQFLLHPLMVAVAWWKLYGFPLDPRLWFSFFLHDIGYFGKPNMDGVEGKHHPFVGAHVMHFLFDRVTTSADMELKYDDRWYKFCLYHSRSIANVCFAPVSELCYADKLAFLLYPTWLMKTLYWLTGEGKEYMANDPDTTDFDSWYAKVSLKNVKHIEGRPTK
jgi:hypothetical protein